MSLIDVSFLQLLGRGAFLPSGTLYIVFLRHESEAQGLSPQSWGWSLIYRKLKSLIITYSNSNRSTCDYGEQRNSGDRGTVGTEERKAQRNTGHRGTVSAEEQ